MGVRLYIRLLDHTEVIQSLYVVSTVSEPARNIGRSSHEGPDSKIGRQVPFESGDVSGRQDPAS